MNIKNLFTTVFVSGMLLAACTSENEIATPTPPDEGVAASTERELLITLKNTLSLRQQETKAGETSIATEMENFISGLDVYVFASAQENGEYTFQELFYYRDDPSQVINQDWAHPFSLSISADGKNSTGLMRLTKGLYVKLFCVANHTKLYSTDAIGTTTEFAGFQPLVQSAPGQADNVVTPGKPTLAEFEKLHTALIDPANADHVLASPLPMTGGYTTPLDLTDFTVSARVQAGIKLTRMVARFDVINDSELSKFKVTGISLANGRKGTTFFPVKPLGTAPADLVTYPYATVTAEQKGTLNTDALNTTNLYGAFYSYPSPKDDGGYLVLKGIYYPNKTEERGVVYQVPFEQVVNGVGSYIEVSANHRYTVAITRADEYHLDFNLQVSDWADNGEVDSYKPDNDFDAANVELLTDAAQTAEAHVLADGTISVLAAAGSKFAFKMSANSAMKEELIYEGDAWIVKTPAVRASMDSTYSYQVADSFATMTNIRPLTIRLTNTASGKKKDIRVIPTPGPELSYAVANTEGTLSKYADGVVTLYNIKGQKIVLTATSEELNGTTGSRAVSAVSWLTLSPASVTTAAGDYTLTLGTVQTLPADAGTVTFTSTATKAVTKLSVKLRSPEFTLSASDFNKGANEGNRFELTSTPKVTLVPIDGNNFSLRVISPEGVTPSIAAGEGDTWLEILSTREEAAGTSRSVTVTVGIKAGTVLTGGKTGGKLTLTNKIPGTTAKKVEIVVSAPPAP